MTEDEVRALSALRFDWALTPDDVWSPHPEHVPELHREVGRRILGGVADAKRNAARKPAGGSPLGLVIQGSKGSGKTHLLGWIREQVQQDGGYFFLIGLSDGATFWSNAVEAVLDGLWRTGDGKHTQLQQLLRRLGSEAGTERAIESLLSGVAISRPRLDAFVRGLAEGAGPQGGPGLQDTARALVLFASNDPELQDIAKDYFLFEGDVDPVARQTWGIRPGRPAQLIVRDLSRLMAMTGKPTVLAIDQIDTLIARYSTSADSVDVARDDAGRDELVTQVADGLMALREVTRSSLSIVACLPNSWNLIRTRAVASVSDRFRTTSTLTHIPTPEIGRALVEKRFALRFAEVGFIPPHPTWPIAPTAFESIVDYTPRSLLQLIDVHVQSCLDTGEVVELLGFDQHVSEPKAVAPVAAEQTDLERLDARFRDLRATAPVDSAFDAKAEDQVVPELLAAGLTAWVEEHGGPLRGWTLDPPSAKHALHGRLRRTTDENVEAEVHWAFRAISSPNAINAQHRIKSAQNVAGIRSGDSSRTLFLLRSTPWPRGPRTAEILAEYRDAGGTELPITNDDLRTFAALKALLRDEQRDPALRPWLTTRRPASGTELLTQALRDADPSAPASAGPSAPEPGSGGDGSPPTRPIPIIASPTPAGAKVAEPQSPPEVARPGARTIPVGRVIGSEQPVTLDLESLRMHTAIFAGSGSGKTVLLRRLVEECALQGISSIVIDPNNDLARLGDAWPSPPGSWGPDDPAKAARYLAETDVVIWTPRRESGRPLTFQPLPDFASVLDDPDEFQMAVDVAFGALAPRVRADGRTRKAQQERAVLQQSIEFFGRHGSGDLPDLVTLMSNLPPAVSTIDDADTMAASMAQTLQAAMITDPLFGGAGQAVDPAVLLTPAAGKRARVSVISLIGLPSDEQRQGFVSQLQMALFAWFKKHPSEELGGLLVMDEAQTIAPSGAMTVATESTLVLASQARKYGLGLVFATQAPKGLHNRIPGNAATQVFGLMNSPSQIGTVQEIARAKGGAVSDISQLNRGEFYFAGEGAAFTKMHTAMCLSHHPSSPLTAEAVISRARAR
jgi:hypothetical protein